MKLRCWPGALARISERCTVVQVRGKVIECNTLTAPSGAQGLPEWTYKGERLYAYVPEFRRVCELHSIEDRVLDPITPPPGTTDTDTDEDAPAPREQLEHA